MLKNLAYNQHSAVLYMCDSIVPILYHKKKTKLGVQVSAMSPSLHQESKSESWVQVPTMRPRL